MTLQCVACPSPNFDARPKDQPADILLLHYTGMETGAAALQRLCDPAARVSSHYTVDEDGTIYNHVPEDCRAWHAGVSYWAGARDINARSIGIEIVNPGHEFGYRLFPGAQIEAVMELALDIFSRHAIPPERVLAHSDVAPARKQDPGELFPWATLANVGIGLWPTRSGPTLVSSPVYRGGVERASASETEGGASDGSPLRPLRGHLPRARGRKGFAEDVKGVGGSFEASLRRFGYGIPPDVDVSLEDVVTAFQRHFRQSRVDGIVDAECESVLASLLVMPENQ